jgi:hypothetical protein
MIPFLEKWLKSVKDSDQSNYGKRQVEIMIEAALAKAPANDTFAEPAASTCRDPISVTELQRGDVFIHKLVGGKVRPWVVLKVFEDHVAAVSLSTGESVPGSTRSKCRLWKDSWICPTVTNVSMDFATKEVTRPYTALRHLDEVERDIIAQLGKDKVTSIADIRNRLGKEAA